MRWRRGGADGSGSRWGTATVEHSASGEVEITAAREASTAIRLSGVRKSYPGGVVALDNLSLRVPAGAFLAVMGPSGSGKSTLLHCAAGLDTPDEGTVRIGDTEITRLSETRRTELRRDRVGFVFQSYNLVPSLTIGQNITLPMRLAGRPPEQEWLATLVRRIGIADLTDRLPAELSGGQQQRASIARALVARPDVVFADEPTGALDLHTAAEVLELLRQLVAEFGQTIVMVTHDPTAASRAYDTVVMADGRIAEVLSAPSADELAYLLTQLGSGADVATAGSPSAVRNGERPTR